MRSPVTCQIDSADAQIAAQKAVITAIEKALWVGGLDESQLDAYQAAFRELELLIAGQGNDDRHRFVIVIPVADRPQQLRDCLDSLLELCAAFGYGGRRDGVYAKVAVVIADDSSEADSIAATREIARHFTAQGIATRYFGLDEQLAVVNALGADEQAALAGILGGVPRDKFSHKGHATTRNIAYLMLGAEPERDEPLLIYTVDSDQEFKVKVGTPQGDREVCAVNFFYRLDEIFAATDALILTGKVVGDPPVSPSVMAGNFLADAVGFLERMAAADPQGACLQHEAAAQGGGDASYHDMADLFGFQPVRSAFRYRCTLAGDHTDADCFADFAHRLNAFFYGEHPTRITYYRHEEALASVQPARTVYAGNYIFRPAGLGYFIPFAPLRLRMSGPTLGRIVKAELAERFVCANLPMLHKRTVRGTGQSEFRPGVNAAPRAVDLGDEFERQFHGDVMLFAIERLTAQGYPRRVPPAATVAATLAAVRAEMLEKYNARRRVVADGIARLQALLRDPAQWWHAAAVHAGAVADFEAFAANMGRNFGADSSCYELINSAANWEKWRAKLLDAVNRYPQDSRAWAATLAAARPAPPGRPASAA